MIFPLDLLDIAREALLLALLLSLPILGAAFAAGLITALLQALTKISEPALTHVPRIAAVTLAALIAAPWISLRVANFTERVWSLIQAIHH
ncbi:MAG: hypothetical protein GY847_08575 [Proteobacteria bacterium]|nr:hypothetical protein [Pseudomonadota bacterium]